ncbi:PREDICTED: cytochrome P450 724B1-like [Populus euphratica]|uniref:Cytochrome P450 724B1 n=1 Tax=Populus euphratica TaxID=75702 RepID=A0AAJ6TLC0_POPEU|nr:PREDICTED: cytochrome P450 724B1-like [Populus euphratica]
MAGELWVGVLVGITGGLLGLIMNHFLPMFLKLGHNVPKGSFGWPLLGETLGFLKPHPSNTLGAFLRDHCSRYGNVFKSHLFLSPTVVSCDQELNYFILQNEGKLFQCSYPKPIHGILGNVSMLVAVGDTHKRLRNVAISLVSITKSKSEFLNDIERTAIQILSSWKNKQQVVFCEEARKFSFNVIVKQVLGLTSEEPETRAILEDFRTFMRGLVSIPLYIPGTPYARAVQARSRISSRVKAIIEERISRNRSLRSDFLEILLSVDTLSEDEKVSFVLDSLLGGYETTSLLMAMVVHLLGQSPTALEQLKLEHEQIRSLKEKDECLNWEDYKTMEFTQNVISEALRYGNIVKFVHRKALKDVKFRDYLIPSGWKVLPVFTAVHLDSSVHANALQFHPWRWETQDQTSKSFTPFGGGSRCCPGSELAKIEVAFFLHHLVQNFRWTAEDADQPMAYPYVEFGKGLLINLDGCST